MIYSLVGGGLHISVELNVLPRVIKLPWEIHRTNIHPTLTHVHAPMSHYHPQIQGWNLRISYNIYQP